MTHSGAALRTGRHWHALHYALHLALSAALTTQRYVLEKGAGGALGRRQRSAGTAEGVCSARLCRRLRASAGVCSARLCTARLCTPLPTPTHAYSLHGGVHLLAGQRPVARVAPWWTKSGPRGVAPVAPKTKRGLWRLVASSAGSGAATSGATTRLGGAQWRAALLLVLVALGHRCAAYERQGVSCLLVQLLAEHQETLE